MCATFEKRVSTGLLLFYCTPSNPPPHPSPPTKTSAFSSFGHLCSLCLWLQKHVVRNECRGFGLEVAGCVCAFSCFLSFLCGWVVKVSGVGEMLEGGGGAFG